MPDIKRESYHASSNIYYVGNSRCRPARKRHAIDSYAGHEYHQVVANIDYFSPHFVCLVCSIISPLLPERAATDAIYQYRGQVLNSREDESACQVVVKRRQPSHHFSIVHFGQEKVESLMTV